MPRIKNTKPTYIYWLQDIRSETIAAGWLQGLPFYVGKTVASVAKRLVEHRSRAAKKPYGEVGPRLRECGEHVRIVTLETVPASEDWYAREKHWIATSRRMFPEFMANVSDGGEGSPGMIPSAATRDKMSAAHRGKKQLPEHIEKRVAAFRGKKKSPEHRAKLAAANRGKKQSPEHTAKIAAACRRRLCAHPTA